MVIIAGAIILPTRVANSGGISGLADPQVPLELYHQSPRWRKGQGNPDLIMVQLGRGLRDRITRFSVVEAPEGRQCTLLQCDKGVPQCKHQRM